MAARTPGFQPIQLTQARLARGLTRVALATAVKRSAPSVSKWESGQQTPDPKALEALAQCLRVPRDYFLNPPFEAGERPRFFRSMANATKRSRERIQQHLLWLQRLSHDLQIWVDLPPPTVPDLGVSDFQRLQESDIENAAAQVRADWGLWRAPIPDLLMVMENAGIIVARCAFSSQSIDGVSHWSLADDRPYVLLSSDKRNAVRSRFDAAHELGHLVLHRHVDQSALTHRDEFKELENQAHRFASAFLMPAEGFVNELPEVSLEAFRTLKPRWGVSIGAMIYRCKDLELITEEHAGRLFKYISARGWVRAEPEDERLALEQPRLIERSIRLLLTQGGYSVEQLLAELRLHPKDIEALAGLPAGLLSNRREQVQLLPTPKLKTGAVHEARAEVVAFPGWKDPGALASNDAQTPTMI
ncbi:MAG: XRE family transcriptional regulator [Lamprobacter sp.]|uniref:helix-turn-helix domain-containing protein n=1 Tax=Lamprobacter sp. TaxID=3100796 RepID=UPI002B25AECB|nr:XRE family transcriptional regulator [Lamprobacter sp.]MEA3641881.1 XRE family transcriptional regulator [Lamprobacter sp.]